MANSKISLRFNSVPLDGDTLSFSDAISTVELTEVFKAVRTNSGESQLGANTGALAYNFIQAFNLDYNLTSLYTVTQTSLAIVDIEAIFPESQFALILNDTLGAVVHTITNEVPPVVFTLDSITISESDVTPCDKVKITVTTNEQADSITSPINQAVTTNPFTVTIDRSELINVGVIKNGATASSNIKVPKLLSTYFSVDKIQTPSNASIVVNNTLPSNTLFSVQYSIDDVNYQTSNNFPSLDFGDYTLYIKDNIGCSTSLTFSIDEFTPNLVDYSGICEISNINSIRYKDDVVWTDLILKTPTNTLSFEENVNIPNTSFTQLFTNNDIVITQIKTNFETIDATLIDDSGNETPLVIDKRTENMNITDIRDAQIVSATYNGTQYTAVKYSGGKVYDPLTLEHLTDYNIGENVPSWMNVNDWLNVEGVGWYKVIDVIYNVDAYVLVLNLQSANYPFTLPDTKKVTSIYNKVDWENYEFNIDFSNKEGFYKVKVECTDDEFGSKNFLSEWINVKEQHNRTLLIQAYNTKNNEINFNTGFKSIIRMPFIKHLSWKTSTEQEIYVTDTNTTALENKYRGFWEFESNLLPTVMAEKVALILLQDRLFIDNISYVLEGSVDSVQVGSQYQIKASLVKSDYVFNSNSGKYIDLSTIEGTLLSINPEGGFLRVD